MRIEIVMRDRYQTVTDFVNERAMKGTIKLMKVTGYHENYCNAELSIVLPAQLDPITFPNDIYIHNYSINMQPERFITIITSCPTLNQFSPVQILTTSSRICPSF
jgi:hypothetical protein